MKKPLSLATGERLPLSVIANPQGEAIQGGVFPDCFIATLFAMTITVLFI
jgi:hypothetical protein